MSTRYIKNYPAKKTEIGAKPPFFRMEHTIKSEQLHTFSEITAKEELLFYLCTQSIDQAVLEL